MGRSRCSGRYFCLIMSQDETNALLVPKWLMGSISVKSMNCNVLLHGEKPNKPEYAKKNKVAQLAITLQGSTLECCCEVKEVVWSFFFNKMLFMVENGSVKNMLQELKKKSVNEGCII